MKKTTIVTIFVLIIGIGAYFFLKFSNVPVDLPNEEQVATTTPEEIEEPTVQEGPIVIGTSAGNRDIIAYQYGTGDKHIVFVGGVHGGYSWNTALVAYELIDYLESNPSAIPEEVSVSVIPVLNPDGLEKVVGTTDRFSASDVSKDQAVRVAGRFNDNTVDLNRNFDCDWQATGVWQDKTVSGGTKAFSEPETTAFKTYIENVKPEAVVVWYSSAGGVYASNCHDGVLPETRDIMNVFAKASGYTAYENFDYYTITGDLVNWLAKIGVPGISVLLTSHETTEWDKNKKGIDALLSHFSK